MRHPAFLPATRKTIQARWAGRCGRCGGPGKEYAHRRTRGIRDEHTACPCNALWLCATCHRWCHQNPVAAQDLGLMLSRYEREPWSRPVQTIAGTALLACDGTVDFVPHNWENGTSPT